MNKMMKFKIVGALAVLLLLLAWGTVVYAHGYTSDQLKGKEPPQFVVPPSGDQTGRLDTAHVQGALRAVSASPRLDTVVLTEGTYYFSGAIDVPGANVELTGAGVDETMVMVVHNSTPNGYLRNVPYWDDWDGLPADYPVLFNFDPRLNNQGPREPFSVTIRDMTFVVADNPADEYFNLFTEENTTQLNNICYISGGSFNSTFENLRIEGADNVLFPLGAAGGSDWAAAQSGGSRGVGTHIVRNVEFSNFGGFGYEAAGWEGDSSIELTDSAFENWGWSAYAIFWNDADITVTEVCEQPDPNVEIVVCP